MSRKTANVTLIGQRYAKAFFSANVTAQEINEFLEVGTLLVQDPLFAKMLDAQKSQTSLQENTQEWVSSFSATLKLSQKVTNFLKLIVLKNRFAYLSHIVKAITTQTHLQAGRDFVTLTLFKAQSDAEIADITDQIKKIIKIDPILNIVIDPTILGGYIIRARSILIDNSLKKRIEKLHNVMKGVA